MSGAHVDVAALRRFAGQLKIYHDNLSNTRAQLLSAHTQLGESWQDSQRDKFDESLRQAIHAIDRLIARIESEQLPYLRRKIEAAERYLGR